MKPRKPVLLSVVIVCAAAGLFLAGGWERLRHGIGSPEPQEPPLSGAASESDLDSARRAEREGHLEMLRKKWDALKATPKGNTPALAKESVSLLGTSAEMVTLLKYLKAQGLVGGQPLIDIEIKELLASKDAAKAREQITRLKYDPLDEHGCKNAWSYYAAQSCTLEEFGKFADALIDDGQDKGAAKQDALIGFSVGLLKEDPYAATQMMVDQLKLDRNSSMVSTGIYYFTKSIPENAKFEEMARLLTHESPEAGKDRGMRGNPVANLKNAVITGWARQAPADAANFIMDHEKAFTPEAIVAVAEVVTEKDDLSGYDWAQTFPEGGLRDQASLGAVTKLGHHPDKAMELALKIQDPALKEQAIRLAKNHQAIMDRLKR